MTTRTLSVIAMLAVPCLAWADIDRNTTVALKFTSVGDPVIRNNPTETTGSEVQRFVTQRFGNKELISILLAEEGVGGPLTGWSLVTREGDDTHMFLVKKLRGETREIDVTKYFDFTVYANVDTENARWSAPNDMRLISNYTWNYRRVVGTSFYSGILEYGAQGVEVGAESQAYTWEGRTDTHTANLTYTLSQLSSLTGTYSEGGTENEGYAREFEYDGIVEGTILIYGGSERFVGPGKDAS